MALQHVDDRLRLVPKEDHVAAKGKAADVRPQLRPCATQRSRQRSQFAALLLQPIDERACGGVVPALSGEISQDVAEILSRRR